MKHRKSIILILVMLLLSLTGCIDNSGSEEKDVTQGVILIRKENKVTVKVEKDCIATELKITNVTKEDIKFSDNVEVIIKELVDSLLVTIVAKEGVLSLNEDIINFEIAEYVSVVENNYVSLNESIDINETSNMLLGDFTNDGIVNQDDLDVFEIRYSSKDGDAYYNEKYDIYPSKQGEGNWSGIYSQKETDGVIDINDYIILVMNLEKTTPVFIENIVVDVTTDLIVGQTSNIIATAYYTDGTSTNEVEIKILNEEVLLLTDKMIKALSAGTTKVIVSVGNEDKEITITVIGVDNVKITGETEVKEGKNIDLDAEVTYTDGSKTYEANWTVDKEEIATITNTGKLSGLKAGKVIVTAEKLGKVDNIEIEVLEDDTVLEVSKIEITGEEEVLEGETITLKALVTYEDDSEDSLDVVWSSDNLEIATVTDGEVIGLKAGTVKIKASKFGKEVTKTIEVTKVKVIVEELKIEGLEEVKENKIITLIATVKYSDGTEDTNVEWTSSDKTIATVLNGKVKGIKEGIVKITAKKDEKEATKTIEVTKENKEVVVKSVELSGSSEVKVGGNIDLSALVTYSDDTTDTDVDWTSSDESIAIVVNGKVTGKKKGTVIIIVKKDGKEDTKTITVSEDIVITNKIVLHVKKYTRIWAWSTDEDKTNYTGVSDWEDRPTMEKEAGDWSTYTIEATSANLKFTDPGETSDLKVTEAGEWWYNEEWHKVNPEVDEEAPVVDTNPKSGKIEENSVEVLLIVTDNQDINPKVYYTIDGTIPTENSDVYNGEKIKVSNSNNEIKVISVDKDGNKSEIFEFEFLLGQDATAPTVKVELEEGVYKTNQKTKLEIEDNKDSDPKAYYTIDGTEASVSNGKLYNGEDIKIEDGRTVINVYVLDDNDNVNTYSFTYYVGDTAPSRDFREENVYFMMTDRFCDGDTSNNNIWGDEYLPGGESQKYEFDGNKTGVLSYYHGGDFKGIIKNLDYLKEMGFTAIWITPVVKQPEGRRFNTVGGYEASAFHGYWGYDFDQIDPHLHSEGKNNDGWGDFDKLISELHARDMKMMLDIVPNHGQPGDSVVGSKTKWADKAYEIIMDGKTWNYKDSSANSIFTQDGSKDARLLDLLDFSEQNAKQELYNTYKRFIDHGVDAFRIDTLAYMSPEFWGGFADEMTMHAKSKGNDNFYMMGEPWTNRGDALNFASKDKLGQLHILDMNCSLLDADIADMEKAWRESIGFALFEDMTKDDLKMESNPSFMGMFVDNHDMYRVNSRLSEDQYRTALNYIYLFRGIPIVFYGTEALYSWEHAYSSDQKEDIVSRWMLGQKGIDYVSNNKPTMYKHLKVLNFLRLSSEIIQKGEQENIELLGDKAVFKRVYNNKVAYVAMTKADGFSHTFTGMANGAYRMLTPDTENGKYNEELINVSGGTYTVEIGKFDFVVLDPK